MQRNRKNFFNFGKWNLLVYGEKESVDKIREKTEFSRKISKNKMSKRIENVSIIGGTFPLLSEKVNKVK